MTGLSINAVTSNSDDIFTSVPKIAPDEALDRLEVMVMQEETTYKRVDFLGTEKAAHTSAKSPPKTTPRERSSHSKRMAVDEECRMKMCEWCFHVIDFLKFRRETVGIAMSYLDRFSMSDVGRTRNVLFDRKQYQLASMTALNLAIKLFEPVEMDFSLLSDMSRGCYSEAEFEKMESDLLSGLQWRVHPPTALSFTHHFLALLPPTARANKSVVRTLLDFSRFQTELAVGDYDCATKKKESTIAIASIRNAMDSISHDKLSEGERYAFFDSVSQISGIDPFSVQIARTKNHLIDIYVKSSGRNFWRLITEKESFDINNAPKTQHRSHRHHHDHHHGDDDDDDEMNLSGDSSPTCVSRQTIS